MITAAVFTGILFLLVFVHCVLLLKGYNVFQKLKKFGTQSSNLYIPKKKRKKIIIIMSLALVFCIGGFGRQKCGGLFFVPKFGK